MAQGIGTTEYSIAAVSKLTGVSCHALRVWERRYGFPIPNRSATGHRRFAHEQVNILRALARLAKGGRPIGELIGEFQSGRLDLRAAVNPAAERKTTPSELVDRLFGGETSEAEALLDRATQGLSPIEVVERVIEPAMVEVGERWFRRECEVFQERCATSILYVRLGRLLDQARGANRMPRGSILVGTVKGDRHEGGVLMVSLALEVSGWRAIPLGVDLPIAEYQKAVDCWRPEAIALSFVLSRNINKRFQELGRIRGLPIFVGGRSIVNHQGLARRHGLIPLIGTLSTSSYQMLAEFEAWRQAQPAAGPTPAR